jgi:peptidoglycan/xylan/chitin deacetylase (PgdA/CDA1 family)
MAESILTLSFDDGFEATCRAVAEVYAERGLRACLNIVATGHEPGYKAPDEWQEGARRGDFGLWRALRAQGHEVMPHGHRHENLAFLAHREATDLIDACLARFAAEFHDWDPSVAVFNFPYNLSTPALEAHLRGRVRACRVMNVDGINPIPTADTFRVEAAAFGPGNCEADLERRVDLLLRDGGWLVYNTHGLDGEGWGPISRDFLARTLDRCLDAGVQVLPTGAALALSSASDMT